MVALLDAGTSLWRLFVGMCWRLLRGTILTGFGSLWGTPPHTVLCSTFNHHVYASNPWIYFPESYPHGSTSQSRIPMDLLLTSQIHLHLSLAVFLGSPWCQHLVQVSSSSPPLLSTLHLKPTFLLGGNLALRMEAVGFLAIGPLDLLFSGGFPLPSLPPSPPFTSHFHRLHHPFWF
ncbi:hypothetical protein Bca101_050205 [Brassica carinata]